MVPGSVRLCYSVNKKQSNLRVILRFLKLHDLDDWDVIPSCEYVAYAYRFYWFLCLALADVDTVNTNDFPFTSRCCELLRSKNKRCLSKLFVITSLDCKLIVK